MLESHSHYLVSLMMVNFHVSIEAALASNLFGRLCEKRIVLVDATDEELINKYQALWVAGPEDREPEVFFKNAMEAGTLSRQVE